MIQQVKEVYGLLRGKNAPAVLELEECLLAKGDMTRHEMTTIKSCQGVAIAVSLLTSATAVLLGHASLSSRARLAGPLPWLLSLSFSTGTAWYFAKVSYYSALQISPILILDRAEERVKMELANIILNKHRDESLLVEAVKRHFFAEHLFSDQYQDIPLFRWRLRNTYVDSAFVERVREIEVNNSDDESGSISRQTTAHDGSFGDLMEDPLACILGSPGSNMESTKTAEHTGNVVRREVRAHRRSHRRHHGHADKVAAP